MGVLKDKLLLEVLYEEYQLVPVRGNELTFTLRSYKPLPQEIAQLSIGFSMTSAAQPIHTMSSTQPIAYTQGAADYEYEFLNSAQSQLSVMLEHFLEKKRFKEFSKTFDKEVESELGKR